MPRAWPTPGQGPWRTCRELRPASRTGGVRDAPPRTRRPRGSRAPSGWRGMCPYHSSLSGRGEVGGGIRADRGRARPIRRTLSTRTSRLTQTFRTCHQLNAVLDGAWVDGSGSEATATNTDDCRAGPCAAARPSAPGSFRLVSGAPAAENRCHEFISGGGVIRAGLLSAIIGFGQIDLLVAALVVVDLTSGRQAPWGGLLVGTAAALKLTPLIFIPYLLLSRRPAMAAGARRIRPVGRIHISPRARRRVRLLAIWCVRHLPGHRRRPPLRTGAGQSIAARGRAPTRRGTAPSHRRVAGREHRRRERRPVARRPRGLPRR